MSDPWLSVIGIGEDGLAGLPYASREALAQAEIVFGGVRHLALAGIESGAGGRGRAWEVPFSLVPVLALRGRQVAVLVSGDPFWHGAGGALLAGQTPLAGLAPGEWRSFPAVSSFQMAANRLGWKLEDVACLGLHAAPFARLVPVLSRDLPVICTLRDGAAVGALASWLCDNGFAATTLCVMESLGGPRERMREARAANFDLAGAGAPVIVGLRTEAAGLARGFGLPDAMFAQEGQITKRPIRAMTLAALAPRPGARLWDLGAGSGSVSVEWCLAGGLACVVERRADRLAYIRANAATFGQDHRMTMFAGSSADLVPGLPVPDAVFIGGGCDAGVLGAVWNRLPAGARLVVNCVTLETEALLAGWQAEKGGDLMRIDIANAAPLGRMRGWIAARPVVQWSVVR